MDLSSITKAWKSILKSEDRPKTHAAARDLARRAVDAGGQNYRILRMAHNLLGMPPQTLNAVLRNWKAAGSLPLREYAPLAAHCLEVDLFFDLCLSNGLLSNSRPSKKNLIRKLYYFPFPAFL